MATSKQLDPYLDRDVIIRVRQNAGDKYIGGTLRKSASGKYHIRYQDDRSGLYQTFTFDVESALFAGDNGAGKGLIEVDRR